MRWRGRLACKVSTTTSPDEAVNLCAMIPGKRGLRNVIGMRCYYGNGVWNLLFVVLTLQASLAWHNFRPRVASVASRRPYPGLRSLRPCRAGKCVVSLRYYNGYWLAFPTLRDRGRDRIPLPYGISTRHRRTSSHVCAVYCGMACGGVPANRCGWMFSPLSSRQTVVQPRRLGARKSFFGLSPT